MFNFQKVNMFKKKLSKKMQKCVLNRVYMENPNTLVVYKYLPRPGLEQRYFLASMKIPSCFKRTNTVQALFSNQPITERKKVNLKLFGLHPNFHSLSLKNEKKFRNSFLFVFHHIFTRTGHVLRENKQPYILAYKYRKSAQILATIFTIKLVYGFFNH